MKKGIMLFAIASSLALLGSNYALAGNRAGAFTLTPGFGYDIFASKRNLENAFVLPEISLGYDFDNHWAVEGMYGSYNSSYHNDGTNGNGSAKGNIYNIDALYHIGAYSVFEPYVAAGLGVLNLNPAGTSANNQANMNAAIGAQIFFGNSVALRPEVRDLYTFAGGYNDVLLSLGVSFLMGGDTAPAPMPLYKGESYK